MPRRGCQLGVRDPQSLLLLPLLARAHRHTAILRTMSVDSSDVFAYASRLAPRAARVVDLRKLVRFALGTIRGIGDPDSYIKPEQPQSSIPPAKINISLSMPFDKLPEDVQNQILQIGRAHV